MTASTLAWPGQSFSGQDNADLALLAAGIPRILGRRFTSLLAVGSVGRAHAEGASAVRAEDYDLIIVAEGLGALERRIQRRSVDAWVREASKEIGLPVSPGILEKRTLPTLPFTLFNYEMRHAHLALAGEDPTALLPAYPSGRLPLIEATRLLLNRGVPLWGAALTLGGGGGISESEADRIEAGHRKVVLGIGDSLLISEGLYHWSYSERARRAEGCAALKKLPGASDLPERYVEALASKRDGRPAPTGLGALRQRTDALLHLHSTAFRYIEERRLGRRIGDWSDYGSGSLDYPPSLVRPPMRRLARLLHAFGRPRSRHFYQRHRRDEAESILLRVFPRYAYEQEFTSVEELRRTLNWTSPPAVEPLDVWERFHAIWERAQ